ncbi:AraC family transcriptional regulator [Oscillatoria sp. FACHB-1407]|uniref:AraC family transcriptional regulator n=1 Tax=Oscillatoria sp. FACHB-1407 TaxID=2692847 RepID=UPI0016884517|nr:AraC family transcriptional regulator [Oscillatoria sp. FACHB-1407]MBD2461483.1 AraC family transcriptional regulator [Oscillatoria sp. FACHB-1407]
MDVLSDVLRVIRLSGGVRFRTQYAAPWSIETPPPAQLAVLLQAPAQRVVSFHIVAEGTCWVELDNCTKTRQLVKGDIIVFPYGSAHILADQPGKPPIPVTDLLPPQPWTDMPVLKYGGDGAATQLICGFLLCDDPLFNPFLQSLPLLIHIPVFLEPTSPLLAMGVRYIIEETLGDRPGSNCLLSRLTELMFVEILRNQMQQISEHQIGWLAALSDSTVSQVLELLHARPEHNWTVTELAGQVGVSRSTLATRFTQLLGQPPMQYLTQWRLQLAINLLRSTDAGMAKIATQVGYESEAAFNRAFKRHLGVPPATWRHRLH